MAGTVLSITTDAGDLPVTVTPDGEFVCTYEGVDMRANTFAALKDKVRGVVKTTVKMAIPITFVDYPDSWGRNRVKKITFTDGTITGIHAGNNNVMLRRKTDTGSSQSRGYGENYYTRMTTDQMTKFARLHDAVEAARKEFDEFKAGLKLPDDRDKLKALWDKMQKEQEAGK